MQRVTSFVATMAHTAGRVLRGQSATVEQSLVDSRLAICRTCDQFEDGGCKLCGCPVNAARKLLNKAANESATCPMGKWP